MRLVHIWEFGDSRIVRQLDKLNGPTYETCTHLGIWRQSYRQTREASYSDNYNRECVPSKTITHIFLICIIFNEIDELVNSTRISLLS